MTRQELQRLRTWADAKIATGQEPQWAWYQLMKLREALDAIVGQMEAESIAIEMRHLCRRCPIRSAVRGWSSAIAHPTLRQHCQAMTSGF